MSLTALLGIGIALTSAADTPSIRFVRFAVGKAVYHSVDADLKGGEVSLETVHSTRLTSVWNLVSRPKPAIAAITGTFFSPGSQKPVADVIVDGLQVASGSIGTALGVSWYGEVSIFDRPWHDDVDWGQYRFGLRGAVRVVQNGAVKPNPRAQRFHDRRIWGRAARTGLGLTSEGRLLLVATKSHVTLAEFGNAMRSRGVREGISLDGGGSTCLFYQGSMVVAPGRKLSNLIVLRRSQPKASLGLPALEAPSEILGQRSALMAAKPSLRPIKP